MFKNLRTSTKLILLCAMFIISVGVTTYSLVTEKQIAVSFARKELVGSKFLSALRNIDVALLNGRPFDPLAADSDSSRKKMLETLAAAHRRCRWGWSREKSIGRTGDRDHGIDDGQAP
jgi:hypothetical protein